MPRKKKIETGEKKRKNFRLPLELTLWAEEYAAQMNTNLTQLIVDHWTKLREKER